MKDKIGTIITVLWYLTIADIVESYHLEKPHITYQKTVFQKPSNENELSLLIHLEQFKTIAQSYGIEADYSTLTYSIEEDLNSKTSEHDPYQNEVVGICRKKANHIAFKKSIFSDEEYGDIGIQAIVFHELGHCLYNLKHDEDEMSIMFKSIKIKQGTLGAEPLIWLHSEIHFFSAINPKFQTTKSISIANQ